MVDTLDQCSLVGPASKSRSSGRLQEQLRLRKGIVLTKVAQELQAPDGPWQVAFADTTQHPQVGLEQRQPALHPVLVDLPTGVFLPGVLDAFVHIALERPLAPGRVGVEPTARWYRDVGSLWHRLDRASAGRLDDAGPLAPAPGAQRGPVFVSMAPAGLTVLAPTTRAAPQRFLPTVFRLAFLTRGVLAGIRCTGAR